MPLIAIALVAFFAAFVQTVSGFGFGLIAMALLPTLIELRVAVPLVAVVAIALQASILLRLRRELRPHAVLRLIVGAVAGIPIGLLLLGRVDSAILLRVLGLVTLSYALYALLNFRLPAIADPRWAYPFGFAGGLLGGMFNTGGPPVIIYGSCRRWPPNEFRANLQAFFIVSSCITVAGHALAGNLVPDVLRGLVAALPAIGLGGLAGSLIARHVPPDIFRRVVLLLLALLGGRLLL
jgi:uncharacterized membrane protein YfcA